MMENYINFEEVMILSNTDDKTFTRIPKNTLNDFEWVNGADAKENCSNILEWSF